jgi:two-component system LytT family response regulator
MNIRALIIDDEPPARDKIRRFLAPRPEITLVGEAGDGAEAVEKILELRPDLLFLDIQMPGGDGFDVLREIRPTLQPKVVFTTAYDAYAVRAFEVEAVDYLLKPFTVDRFNAAVDRALRAPAGAPDLAATMTRLLADSRAAATRAQRLLVRHEGRLVFVNSAEIEWAEAEEKYVRLHTRGVRYLIRQSMNALAERLAAAGFVRVHRGALLNLAALREIAPLPHGECAALLKSGARLDVGRNYKEALLQAVHRYALPAEGDESEAR